ncbi:MAG: peroxiredoxin-like family protein [Bacteroidota bacterium]
MPSSISSSSLKTQLDARKAQWAVKAPDEIKRLYQEGIQAVVDAGVIAAAKQIGESAPDFVLPNALGHPIRMSKRLQDGPLILTWYRGGWCPYCNLTLRHLQTELPRFQAAGAQLMALTPELPDQTLSTTEKNELSFEVLSDVGNAVARLYGIVFDLTPAVAEKYQAAFDLHGYNGDESNQLPLAATYVIDQAGVIRYAFLDAEYRNRAESTEILAALKRL